jgi:hypothetical protein
MDTKKPNDKDTVGQVGSSVDGGLDPANNNDEQITQKDLKGKKVDADPSQPSDQPADQ